MDKKEFWIEVSFTGRMKMIVNAENEEEAKEKVFGNIQADFKEGTEDIQIEEVEWDLINEAATGNMKEPYVDDFHIEELEEN